MGYISQDGKTVIYSGPEGDIICPRDYGFFDVATLQCIPATTFNKTQYDPYVPDPKPPEVFPEYSPVYNQPGEKPDNEEIVRENIQCLWGETWWDANGNGHCQSLMCAENETHVWNPDGTEQCVSTISVSDVPDDFPIYADILPDGTMTISHTPQVDPWSVPCVAPNVRRTNGSCGPYIENIPPQAVQSVQLQPTTSFPLPNTTAAPSVTGIAAVDNFLGQFVDAKGQILGMSPVVAIAIAVGGVLLISSGGRK